MRLASRSKSARSSSGIVLRSGIAGILDISPFLSFLKTQDLGLATKCAYAARFGIQVSRNAVETYGHRALLASTKRVAVELRERDIIMSAVRLVDCRLSNEEAPAQPRCFDIARREQWSLGQRSIQEGASAHRDSGTRCLQSGSSRHNLPNVRWSVRAEEACVKHISSDPILALMKPLRLGGWGGLTQETNLIPHDKRVWAFTAAMLALFTSTMSGSIVTTAVPTIVADLHGFTLYGWVFTGYALATAAVVPIVGTFSDVYGRRPFLLWGLVIFMSGSLLAGFSPTMESLIAARCLSGAGGGALVGLAMMTVADIFPPRQRGRWIGIASATAGISTISGPAVGGAITQHLGWRWVFFSAVPLALIAWTIVGLVTPKVRTAKRGRPDILGSALIVGGLIPLLLALTWGGTTYAWRSLPEVGLLAISGSLLALFVFHERTASSPLIALDLCRNRLFIAAVTMTLFFTATMASATTFAPLFIQGALGKSPQYAGFVMIPMFVAHMSSSIATGQVISRTGLYRPQLMFSCSALVAGALLLTRLTPGSSSHQVELSLIMLGLGTGGIAPFTLIAVQGALPHRFLGAASSVRALAQSLGGAIAIPVMTTIVVTIFSRQLPVNVPAEARTIIERHGLDPQSLLTPASQASIRSDFLTAPNGEQFYVQFVDAFHETLAGALNPVFWATTGLAAAVFLLALVMPRMTLAERHDDAALAAPVPIPGESTA
jgi:EmrB/QacA subfamily drug resistance transporter